MKTPGLDVYRLASTVANDMIRDTDGRQRHMGFRLLRTP